MDKFAAYTVRGEDARRLIEIDGKNNSAARRLAIGGIVAYGFHISLKHFISSCVFFLIYERLMCRYMFAGVSVDSFLKMERLMYETEAKSPP